MRNSASKYLIQRERDGLSPIPVSLHQAGVPLPASLLTQRVCSSTVSTSDANDPMAIISMLFLFVKQSAFICRTFIKNGSGRGRNGCTKFLPRLSSYSPRHSPHAQSGNVLLSQVFPHVLNPPLAAHMGEPNQVQCWTLA